ncbi:MAG TPA: PIG-L family deacetylase [Mycobacteriales bacterium]|nr:PIG-L family deacetylase [Mycobacteriales bacterium]
MTERQLTLMAVHAHPDDEATGTGGVLAKAAAEGIRTVLVTCTDGRCGDGPGGVKPGEPGHDPNAVAAARVPELEKSCEILGISDLELLGYHDSGMIGWEQFNNAPGSFWSTPVDEAAARLAVLIEKYQPDVIVTYDENGFYGHPDHIQAHRITMAAHASTGSRAKVYWGTVPKSRMAEFADAIREAGVADWDEELPDGEDGQPDIGLPDEQITTWVDIADYAEQKFQSLAAHASQSENIFFLQLGLDTFTKLMGTETFVRVRDTTGAPLPEKDLFDGLR